MNTKSKRLRQSVYCESTEHRSFECTQTTDLNDRDKILSGKFCNFDVNGIVSNRKRCTYILKDVSKHHQDLEISSF